jgi:hypothetical protein
MLGKTITQKTDTLSACKRFNYELLGTSGRIRSCLAFQHLVPHSKAVIQNYWCSCSRIQLLQTRKLTRVKSIVPKALDHRLRICDKLYTLGKELVMDIASED